MARTAPIPNIPAIPGMNPGVWIMGGGGSGGGSGGKGGKGGAGDQGANGNNGGNDPNGGGKNAGACGPGSGGGCPNPIHGNRGLAAGDPVEPLTGRVYTTAEIDLALPGHIPFVIRRVYDSTNRDHDAGLGFGWSHSLAYRLCKAPGGRVRVFAPLASTCEGPRPEVGGSVRLPVGTLHHTPQGYCLDEGNGLLLVFRDEDAEDGDHRLSAITDVNGASIVLLYDRGIGLTRIVDSVGRQIRVRRAADGHIAAFEVKNASAQGAWKAFARYRHDAGQLVEVTDGEGAATRFAYDDDHRLISIRRPGGLGTEFRYDRAARCVESWCHRDDGRDALAADVPAVLADGTPAKGFLHVKIDHCDGFSEVVTSRAIRRVEASAQGSPSKATWAGHPHTFEYDRAGDLIAYADGMGHVRRAAHDDRGRVVSEMLPDGGTYQYAYDDKGSVVESVNPLGQAVRYERDDRGRILSVSDDAGLVVAFTWDAHGQLVEAQLPNGGVSRMTYDALGNRVRVEEPNGSSRAIEYDFLGRITATHDELGQVTHYTYDGCGRVASMRAPDGSTYRYEYDPDGRLCRQVGPDGLLFAVEWGGIGVVTRARSRGYAMTYEYDREQDLVRVVGENGEAATYERDSEGRILGETTFEGRKISYRYDGCGRAVFVQEGARSVELSYDPAGRLIQRKWSDESVDELSYDALGRLEQASAGGAVCRFSYDLRGNVVRERVSAGGRNYEIDYKFDALGKCVEVRSAAGRIEYERDASGLARAMIIDGQHRVALDRDARGHVERRRLPGGGVIEESKDWAGYPLSTRAFQRVTRRPGEPEWVGTPADQTFVRAYQWTSHGELSAIVHGPSDVEDLVRDGEARVVERRRSGRRLGAIQYGTGGEVAREGELRRWGPGGRCVERDGWVYTYDVFGRLELRRGPDGAETRFEWGDSDDLRAVIGAGFRYDLTYDPFRRLIGTRFQGEDGVREVWREWAGSSLIRQTARRGGEERQVRFFGEVGAPLPDLVEHDGALEHLVRDASARVSARIAMDGTVAGHVDTADLWGLAAPGAEEAPHDVLVGQWQLPEVGLHYGGWRVFDPKLAQYLSPEPWRMVGGLRSYAYVNGRPVDDADWNGLYAETTITLRNGTTMPPVRSNFGRVHPAVAAALPPNNAVPASGQRYSDNRGACAEARAMSEYLYHYESQTGRPIDPNTNPNWQQDLHHAMSQIDPNGGISTRGYGNKGGSDVWPACENCSQMVPRLFTMAGAKPGDIPPGIFAPGTKATDRAGNNIVGNRTFPPPSSFVNNPANAAVNTNYPTAPGAAGSQPMAAVPGGWPSSSLGTWELNNGGWNRVH